jgi:hypothetical protein
LGTATDPVEDGVLHVTSRVPSTATENSRLGLSVQTRPLPITRSTERGPTSVGLAIAEFNALGRALPYQFFIEETDFNIILKRAVALSTLPIEEQFKMADLRDLMEATSSSMKLLFAKGALAVELHHGSSTTRTAFQHSVNTMLRQCKQEIQAWESTHPQPELRIPIDPSIDKYERMV